MSCAYRALPRMIPNLLLSAKKSTNVAIISPWVQDVVLHMPIITSSNRRDGSRRMYFSQFLNYLIENKGLKIYLIMRDNDSRVKYATRVARRKNPDHLNLIAVQYLHAKAVVTDSHALLTSANLIPTSLYRNVESCSLQINRYQNTEKYIEYEFGLKLK